MTRGVRFQFDQWFAHNHGEQRGVDILGVRENSLSRMKMNTSERAGRGNEVIRFVTERELTNSPSLGIKKKENSKKAMNIWDELCLGERMYLKINQLRKEEELVLARSSPSQLEAEGCPRNTETYRQQHQNRLKSQKK